MLRISKPKKRLGAWLARADNTVYQAATDGSVQFYGSTSPGELQILTDSSNPPTTKRASSFCAGAGSIGFGKSKVRKNHYWKTLNAATIWWIPDGQ